jgi:predicted DNA-binding protein
MKRTQLYLDDDMARILSALSRQTGRTVSDLVRESLKERYMGGKELDKGSLARQMGGIWEKRKDIKDINSIVRNLRKGKRLRRLGLGSDSAGF